ncbi:MAG: element excision factor XisH family protein [Saprospiraceae bacterium]
MPRKDKYHSLVREALELDGWVITDDPLTVPTPGLDFYIDLGAERDMIGAQKEGVEIAIEIKSLEGNSFFYDFHQALGQFMMYRLALKKAGKKHVLFLAIPDAIFVRLKRVEIYREAWKEYQVNMLIFNHVKKKIVKWIKN